MAAVLALALVSPAAPAAPAASASQRPHPSRGAAAVISWNAVAADAFAVDSKFGPPLVNIGMAYVQAAVYNAVVGVKGGFAQYKWNARAPRRTSVEAAVAAAARSILLTYAPAAKLRVDGAYTMALGAVPDGPAQNRGVAFGERAAARILALRAGDGWMAAVPFVRPQPPAPGVWRPTPPDNLAYAAPWAGSMVPFLMTGHGQFRPAAPPTLTSAQYAADLNEVEAIGSATSTTRTPLQTAIAHLYGDNNFGVQLQGAYRDHLYRHPLDAARTARYFAVADLAAADATIASWDAKFVYGNWRPISAIRLADTDGNPATTANPAWTPLIVTPGHPDYLSGHTTVTGAVTTALTRLTGTQRIDLNMPSPSDGTTRHYTTAAQLNAESIGARIWAGIHTRTADEVGNAVGKKVGALARQYFHRR
jgi:hypothetical protein